MDNKMALNMEIKRKRSILYLRRKERRKTLQSKE
jgi:hypothetical protein